MIQHGNANKPLSRMCHVCHVPVIKTGLVRHRKLTDDLLELTLLPAQLLAAVSIYFSCFETWDFWKAKEKFKIHSDGERACEPHHIFTWVSVSRREAASPALSEELRYLNGNRNDRNFMLGWLESSSKFTVSCQTSIPAGRLELARKPFESSFSACFVSWATRYQCCVLLCCLRHLLQWSHAHRPTRYPPSPSMSDAIVVTSRAPMAAASAKVKGFRCCLLKRLEGVQRISHEVDFMFPLGFQF